MSQENLEAGRPDARVPLPVDAPLGRGEAEIREWVAESWDQNGDYYPVRKFPESRPCHGRDEIAAFLIDYGESHARLRTEGRGSGLTLDGDIYYALWLRHGRCFRQEDHLTPAGALHALGFHGDTLEAVGLTE